MCISEEGNVECDDGCDPTEGIGYFITLYVIISVKMTALMCSYVTNTLSL